ncbi:MAG: hypothetical protein R6W77_08005 [Trueperaceae bacterium]
MADETTDSIFSTEPLMLSSSDTTVTAAVSMTASLAVYVTMGRSVVGSVPPRGVLHAPRKKRRRRKGRKRCRDVRVFEREPRSRRWYMDLDAPLERSTRTLAPREIE